MSCVSHNTTCFKIWGDIYIYDPCLRISLGTTHPKDVTTQFDTSDASATNYKDNIIIYVWVYDVEILSQ